MTRLATIPAALVLACSLACAVASAAGVASGASGATPPGARELHAAQCVAALQVNSEALAAKVKGGDESARPLLQSRIESGAAFVGDTYLHDDQDEGRARGLANDALEKQKALSAPELAARQATCADEGAKLLADANGLERAVVRRVAKRRMDKLLSN
jgi:hypothetical protein